MALKDQIVKLRNEGKSYKQISDLLNCTKSTVCYHVGLGQKERVTKNRVARAKRLPIARKLSNFRSRQPQTTTRSKISVNAILKGKMRKFRRTKDAKTKKQSRTKATFSLTDLLHKIGANPKCYLTGKEIDLSKSRTYHLDHIVPSSKGGSNDLDNLGLACKEANEAKAAMTLEEFIQLCRDVVEYQDCQIPKT